MTNIHKSIDVIQLVDSNTKKCDHPTIFRKAFDKVQYFFIIKSLKKVEIGEIYPGIIKLAYDKAMPMF